MSMRSGIRNWVSTVMVVCLLVPVGCPLPPVVPGPPPPPYPESTCEEVCEHWRKLDCKEAEPSKGGGSCEAVCVNVQESGIIKWDLGCRASVRGCDQIDRCEDLR
jgi:hypothetical protein